ncbi:MAG TPA: hypothetical protein VG010_10145 [Solirubrobacteraceae bacterium]|jgi:hypothetical protein|nr:hypothetical protein [Solirubrobacteraceae bacterium]
MISIVMGVFKALQGWLLDSVVEPDPDTYARRMRRARLKRLRSKLGL